MNTLELPNQSAQLSAKNFQVFATFVTEKLGIKMPAGKITMLQSRLQRRLRALGLESFDQYRERLFDSELAQDELTHFVDVVTTNKTDFFREPAHFRFLVDRALPSADVAARAGHRPYSVWCAGCSTGKEPYTLAMVLNEHARQSENFNYSIFGTDICSEALEKARRAVYAECKIDPVPVALRQRYLLRSRDPSKREVRVVPELRRRVSYQRLNFMDANYGINDRFDAIFFRNVMIYFDKPTQEAVINKLCRHLRPGGFLFVGHSESLAGLRIPVRLVTTAVYQLPLSSRN